MDSVDSLFLEPAAESWSCHRNATVCSGSSCVLPPSEQKAMLKLLVRVLLELVLGVVMFAMGCTVELQQVLGHLRRPWGISIGFLCQWGIMPLTGFLLPLVLRVSPLYAVVITIMGCCPGATASNIVTYFVDGDMALSICMTTVSTILALGMMPLTLLIYTSLWVSPHTVHVPYGDIGISLVTLLVPVSIGMSVKWKWPQKAQKIAMIGSIAGCSLLLLMAVGGAILYSSSWNMDTEIWIIAAIFPVIGCSLGFLLALLGRQSWARCRTIAVETCIQNAQMWNTIVQLSLSPADLEVVSSFSVVYGLFQSIVGICMVAGDRLLLLRHRPENTEIPSLDKETGTVKLKNFALENGGFESQDEAQITRL